MTAVCANFQPQLETHTTVISKVTEARICLTQRRAAQSAPLHAEQLPEEPFCQQAISTHCTTEKHHEFDASDFSPPATLSHVFERPGSMLDCPSSSHALRSRLKPLRTLLTVSLCVFASASSSISWRLRSCSFVQLRLLRICTQSGNCLQRPALDWDSSATSQNCVKENVNFRVTELARNKAYKALKHLMLFQGCSQLIWPFTSFAPYGLGMEGRGFGLWSLVSGLLPPHRMLKGRASSSSRLRNCGQLTASRARD